MNHSSQVNFIQSGVRGCCGHRAVARCSSDALTSLNLLTALPGVAFVVGNKHGGAEVAEFRARRRTRCARRRTPHTHTHATFILFCKHAVTTARGRASDRTEAVTATRKDQKGGLEIFSKSLPKQAEQAADATELSRCCS